MSTNIPERKPIECVATTHQEAQFLVLSASVAEEEARELREELGRLPEEHRSHIRAVDLDQAISSLADEISTTWTSPHPIHDTNEYSRQTLAIGPKLERMRDLEVRAATIKEHRKNLADIPTRNATAEAKQEWIISYMQKRVLRELATLQDEPTGINKNGAKANPGILLAAAVTPSYSPGDKKPRELLEKWILNECAKMEDSVIVMYVTMALHGGYLAMSPDGPIKTREELIRRIMKVQLKAAGK